MRDSDSLRLRIAVALGTVALMVWIAGGVVTVWVARHESREVVEGQLAQTARLLATLPVESFEGSRDPVPKAGAPASRYEQAMAFQLWNRSGLLVYASPGAPSAAMPAAAELDRVRSLDVDGRRWLARAAASPAGGHVIQVLAQGEIGAGFARDAVRYFGFSALLAIPLLLVLGALAVDAALTPLSRLRAVISGRKPEDLTPIRLEGVPREIGGLVEAINGLSRRHAELLAGVRRFTGDAAHELRTPVAAIRLHAQVALSEPEADWRDASLHEIDAAAARTSALLEQLFTLAHLDYAELDYKSVECDLALLAAKAARVDSRVALRAPQGGIHAPCIPELVELALRNLLSNALKHGGGGPVELELQQGPGCVRIAVSDQGPGVPREYAQAVFDPFFRVPGTATAGSGLGLSIVRRVAHVHGGAAYVDPAPRARGARIVMEIPGRAAPCTPSTPSPGGIH